MTPETELDRMFAQVFPSIPKPHPLEINAMLPSATQHWLDSARIDDGIPMRRKAKCADGFEVSIQASRAHYCQPRDDDGPYWEVELGFPTQRPTDEIMEFAEDESQPTRTVYGYVPIEMVDELIAVHGGIDPIDADETANGLCAQGDD